MTIPALHLQERFHASVNQHRNKGLDARRTLELVVLCSVNFLHGVNRGIRFTRQQFNFRFSRNGWARHQWQFVHFSTLPLFETEF